MAFDIEEAEVREKSVIDFKDPLRVRAALLELEAFLSSGFSDEMARYDMGIPVGDYERLKKIYYERETQKIKKSTAHEVFIDFALGQVSVLKSIDVVMEEMKDSKQYAAAIGGLRLASDIKKRILEVGQELGVLEKKPDEKRHIVITGTIEEMRAAVAKEVVSISAMMKAHGGKDLLALEAGKVHRDPTPTIAAPSTRGRATAHHGRRVVRVGAKKPA